MKRMALIMLMLITGIHGFLPPPSAWAEGEQDQVQEGLLVNSGFEATEAGASWSGGVKPANWGQWLPTGTPILGVDSEIFKSGKQSVSIEGPAGTASRAAITQSIPVEVGKTYRISGWVKTEAVSNAALIRYQMKRTGTSNVLVHVGTLKGTQDWTYMEKLFTVPDNAASPPLLTVELFLETGTGKAWFDDVLVEEPLQSIAIEPDVAYLNTGESLTPSVRYEPGSSLPPQLQWSASNREVVEVTDQGDVTGLSTGLATVTAATYDGAHTSSMAVSVNAPDTLRVDAYEGETTQGQALLGQLSARDSSGADLTYLLISQPAHGVITLKENGSFTYYPDSGFSGEDRFQFAVLQADTGGAKFGQGTIDVTPVNAAPLLDLEWGYTTMNTSLSGQFKKAEDPDGDPIAWKLEAPPAQGTVQVDAEGTYRYAPNEDYLGYDRFRVSAEDGRGGRTESDMLVFVGPTSDRISESLHASSARSHPRLLASTDDLNRSKQLLASGDRYMTEWMELLRNQADPVLATTPLTYQPNGGNAYMLRDRLIPTALMYRLTGESRYAERAWQELEAMTHYPDWGGRTNNILALSELSFAVALAYDWIYDDLNEAQRAQLNAAIRDHALAVALDWYRGEFRHNGEHNNINLVDNGGLGLLALAVADEPETEEQALEVIQSTFQKLQYALRHYTEDGSWPEGPAYWHYGGQYLAMYIQGLNKSLGTDYGLSLLPGYEASGAYPYHLLGEGGVFNFYDGGVSYNMYESLWFASFFDKPEYAWFIGDLYERKGYFHPLYLVFYEPGMFETAPTELDRFFTGIESASMRSAWDDPYALFASMKGVNETMRSHNDLDGGTFVFDALGVRWASDLGNESYSLPGFWDYNYNRWTYYRKKTEGHNTIVINPVENPIVQQEPYGTALTIKKESKPRGAFTILDMTDLYRKDAGEMLRGMKLSADRRELIVQDEMKLKLPSELYWFMHTEADVEIVENGRAAILSQLDKRLYVELAEGPADARFSVMDAAPLATSPNPDGQTSNEGMRKLTIHLEHVQDVRLSVRMVPLYASDPIPPAETGYTPLLEWTIPDGDLPEPAARPMASRLLMDGMPLHGFRPEITYYEVGLPFDAPSPPVMTAEAEHAVSIDQADTIPGTATIVIQNDAHPNLSNRYTIQFTRNPAIGEPPNHLKYQVQHVTASAVPESANIPEHSVDGNLSTRWSAPGTEYVQLDLGEPKPVGAVSLAIYLGDTRKNRFDVLASVDGEEWSTIYENGLTSGTTVQPETFLVEQTTARYIRILGKGNNANPWNSFTEVGVFPLAPIVMRVEASDELKLGESGQIQAWYGFPGGKREQAEELTYTSDAPDIIQVSSTGRMKAISPGSAAISVKDQRYGFVETLHVTAAFDGNEPYLRLLGKDLMTSKSTQQLRAELLHPDGRKESLAKLSYRSSNPHIISVNAQGVARANQSGIAVVSVTDRKSGKTDSIAITVR